MDSGWWTETTDDEIVCGGPSPASMRGGALVGAFAIIGMREQRRTGAEREMRTRIRVFMCS